MPLGDIMSLWYRHEYHNSGEQTDPESWSGEFNRNQDGTTPEVGADERDEEVDIRISKMHKYRQIILQAPAYQWLIADVAKSVLLMPSASDASTTIKESILAAFPSPPSVSRRVAPRPSKITFVMAWDLAAFCTDQEFNAGTSDSLARVITLTGSQSTAQALTAAQYLQQTWQLSGRVVLELAQEVLQSEVGSRVHRTLCDGTAVTGWIETMHLSGEVNFLVEAIGTAYTLAELGEQLAWMAASLRSSQYPDEMCSIQPKIEKLQVLCDYSAVDEKGYLADVLCVTAFNVSPTGTESRDQAPNGQCWHNLFRNPVLVEGFPISRRSTSTDSVTGLEIPLPMMAGLARGKTVTSFSGRTAIKGFSTLLVPTGIDEDIIFWHLIHNQYGDRVSFIDCAVAPDVGHIPIERLHTARHILGWCPETRFLAGTGAGKYNIKGSQLPRPPAGCLLQQATISSGQLISGGAPFSIFYKDSPFHVSRGGYIRKLQWISRKFVVLWDEEGKRGWLVNGTSALLHLVRASLDHNSKDKFSSEFLLQLRDLQEAPPHASYTSDSAIAVLLNRTNRELKVYAEREGHVHFEDRVEHIFSLMEQAIDHQFSTADPYSGAYRTKQVSRAHLEGWDFRDLAIDEDPAYPRVAKMSTTGMGWIELARSLHAVTLLGRGFGEIITAINEPCSLWAQLPTGQYLLAACVSDLKDIMEAVGDATASPARITNELVWLNSDSLMAGTKCGCKYGDVDEHVDVIQVLLPHGLAQSSLTRQPLRLEGGAVVFGHNKNIPWFWRDIGDPVPGNPGGFHKPGALAPPSHAAYGSSISGESDNLIPSRTSETSRSSIAALVERPLKRSKPGCFPLKAYTIGIVCALSLELFAIRALFDVTHTDDPWPNIPSDDSNHYALGEMGKHKVVAACLPDGEYGTNSAADVAANLRRTFPSIRFCLLVGIGGGVPSPDNDIRVGDVVVSKPTGNALGVIQYDMGKANEDGIFTPTGFLHQPPRILMTALSQLRSDPNISALPLQEYLTEIADCRREYRYPGSHLDRLCISAYKHASESVSCGHSEATQLQPRQVRPDTKSQENSHTHNPQIHYGTIASGNRVIRDAKFRDHWGQQSNVLCFEMEAAGIMNILPCLVIRGICDYSDSHKNKQFQNYAAAAAASYAKLLLSYVKSLSDVQEVVDADVREKVSLGRLSRAFKKGLGAFAR
ncbi:hypothetical protein BJX99DRAFT_269232 [Aspergillus californicus]